MLVTQSRILYKKLMQKLHTSRNNNSNFVNTSAALYSRPITTLSFGHAHASFVHATDLHCIRCKKLVQEKIEQKL